jgi:hypothetical protein
MPNPMQMMQMLQQLKGNPMQFLSRMGLQVPAGMNDPQQMVQHLLNSGQRNQQQFDMSRQSASQWQGQGSMFPGGAQRR